tara:strand:+ start:210 stop:647 length:438 start_codon:yes stop_codon:yes gene_type:complete
MKNDDYYLKLDKRSKEYKQWKLEALGKPSEGLGDTVEKIFKATGIDKLAKFILGEDCGCDSRKKALNELYPYLKPNCLTELEYDYLKEYFDKYPTAKGTLQADYIRKLYVIYNRVFNQKKTPSNCPACVRSVLQNLKTVYLTYEA